jgi:hypothetical protein
MSEPHGSESRGLRRRPRDDGEARCHIGPDAALGLTEDGRRLLAALEAMGALPPDIPEAVDKPAPHER